MEEKSKKRAYQLGWSLIPPAILCRKDLSANEKLLWGRINGLTTKEGYCFASNEWLGEQIGLSSSTVSDIISSLVRKNLLHREIIRNENNEIVERRLYPLSVKERIPIRPITDTPTRQRTEERNRDISNRDENNYVEIQRIYDFFISSFKKNTNQYKLTPLRRQKIKKRLEDAGKEMLKRAIANTAASPFHRGKNDRGWQADLDFIIRSYEQVEKLANMQVPKKEEEKLDLTRSSANPLYRQWLIEGAKEDFEDWVKKRY